MGSQALSGEEQHGTQRRTSCRCRMLHDDRTAQRRLLWADDRIRQGRQGAGGVGIVLRRYGRVIAMIRKGSA
jgi:hypothetical protein